MVLSQDLISSATLRYLGTSAQKTRLVVNLIRGKDVGEAAATLRFTKKAVAGDIARLLDSAVANARQKAQEIDVDRLYVHTAFVDGGPSMKRIQPAPMGRAFRILKRVCHVTLGLGVRKAPQPARPARSAAGGTTPEGETGAARPARPRRAPGRSGKGGTGRGGRKPSGGKTS